MESGVTIEKSKLQQIVKDNRKKHKELFEEAEEAFHKKVGKTYDKIHTKATSKKGLALRDAQSMLNRLTEPDCYLDDYDRVLGMIDLEVGETIKLNATEYSRYIEDNWDWKDRFSNQYFATTGKFAHLQ